jgi:AraC-like DNA-binding protein
MDINLDVQKKLSTQFIEYFDMKPIHGEYVMNSKFGNGLMKIIELPSKLEFYHFKKCKYNIPIHMKTVNPINTDWYIFHINLSNIKQTKFVEGNTIEFHKHLPIGVIIYGPGIAIETDFEPHQEVEVVSFRFHRNFLKFYFDEEIQIEDKVSYEDLDYQLEELLRLALLNIDHKIVCHRYVLEFLTLFITKLKRRKSKEKKVNLHADDIKSLFLAASHLRNPSAKELPFIQELAAIANMSTSKFKSSFKQLFGTSPKQFHHKIRMEYAKSELMAKRKTPTDLSFEFGYSHPSNFTSAFKKYFDELPSAYT